MHHFHLVNEKVDILLEVAMGQMEKDGKEDGKKVMHEAAELCKTLILFTAFFFIKTIS